MDTFEAKIKSFSQQYREMKNNPRKVEDRTMPGKTHFIEGGDILTIPRDDGDCRYPYGRDGFNFWAYTSGYMHANEGLFSMFSRSAEGQEPKIAFFAGFPKGGGDYSRVALLSVPCMEQDGDPEVERYTVFSKAAAYYITEVEGMRFGVRAFAGKNNELFFSIRAENLMELDSREIYISSFLNPFLSHDLMESGEYRWFREVRVLEPVCGEELPGFLIKVNEDISRTRSISNYGVLHRSIKLDEGSRLTRHEETASRYGYVGGSRSSLHTSPALRKGTFGEAKKLCAFTEVGIAGDLIHMEMGNGGQARLDLRLTWGFDDGDRDRLLPERMDGAAMDGILEELEKEEAGKSGGLTFIPGDSREKHIKAGVFAPFFEHLKKQVEFCSLVKGYVQLTTNSLIGIRDIFQAIEGLLYWQPEAARAKMLEALDFIAPDGRCPRQYSLPGKNGASPVMDLRPYIDQGAWVISTIHTYLKATGDFGFLDQVCGYMEIVEERNKTVRKSSRRDSVLQHMFRIMDYLLGRMDGQTCCIHALYGDWNDALDGLGVSGDPAKEYGTGVSVMASLQVCKNLREMLELLKRLDASAYGETIRRYEKALEKLRTGIMEYAIVSDEKGEKRILHGWGDERSYLVGSFKDPDGRPRDGLTSNAFWVLSGLYDGDPAMGRVILEAFNRLDSKYGLKTFEPHFEKDTPGVGRIPKLPGGTAENGAAYVHASAFGIMALFRMGQPEEAWRQLCKSLPFTHERVSCSPYVVPNSYGYNEEKGIDGESMLDWQTGSSNVILKTLINDVFGVEPEFGGLWIRTAAWSPFDSFEFRIKIKGCRISLRYKKSGGGRRLYRVDGTGRNGVFDGILGLEKLWIPEEELKRGKLDIEVEDGEGTKG